MRVRLRLLVAFQFATLPFAAFPWAARAQDAPHTMPTRDVDVTYRLGQLVPASTPQVIEQRLRWAVGAGLLRIDPPTTGIYVILDTHAHRMSTVRESDHSVLVIDNVGAPGAPGVGTPPPGSFLRDGEAVVATLPCTQWTTKDNDGAPALVCITADGVMLRAVTSGRTVMEATSVTYGPLDAALFAVPPGYTRLQPPPRR